MSERKQNIISEETRIMLKPAHIYAALSGVVTINIIILMFFYNLLKEGVDNKVDNAIYEMRSEYVDSKMIESKEDMKDFETTVRSLSNEMRILQLERNNSNNSQNIDVNNLPPSFSANPNSGN